MTTKAILSNFKATIMVTFLALSILALLVVMNTTNPTDSSPLVILCVFLLVYIVILCILFVISLAGLAIIKALRPQTRAYSKRWYYVLSVLALAPVLLAALNTLGRLGAAEVLLIIVLTALGCFYVLRRIK